MNILAIDTSMQACSAAVLRHGDGERICSAYIDLERGHAERLMGMIDQVLNEAGLTIKQIDRLAVCTGPGSFTGVRIGVASARGLVLAAGMEIVAENALRLIAAGCFEKWAPLPGRIVAVAIDARREQIYLQLFDERGALGAFASGTPQILRPEQIKELQIEQLLPCDQTLFVVGSGREILANALGEKERQNICLSDFGEGRPQPHAAVLARLALTLPVLKNPPSPLYLRAPDAKIQSGYAIERQ